LKTSALHSLYVIDGQKKELSPARMLEECLAKQMPPSSDEQWDSIVDETIDASPVPDKFDPDKIDEYIPSVEKTLATGKDFPVYFSSEQTRGLIYKTLIDALWRKGHFTLEDLSLSASWKWDTNPVGNNAGFYNSVEALATLMEDLDMQLTDYSYEESSQCELTLTPGISHKEDEDFDLEDDIFAGITPSSKDVSFEDERALPDTIQPNENDWLVYIPFDTCDYRLGGSAFIQSQGKQGYAPCDPSDPDYFIDCYEVIKEMVEDGIAISGTTVCEGGLISALRKMTASGNGIDANISGIMKAYSEKDPVRILFSEVPGVIIQIRDIDYDYLDAELLLQDVAWFPLGHPKKNDTSIIINHKEEGIASILQSLVSSQASEGED